MHARLATTIHIALALVLLSTGCGDNNCGITTNSDGTSTITCDGKTATVGGPDDGCTITHNSNGTSTITCDDGTTVTVGGTDESCTIVHNTDGTSTITCGDGTTVTVGGHDNSCTIAANGDGTSTITCDDGTSVTVGGADDSCHVAGNGGGSIVVTCDDGTSLTIVNNAVVFFQTPDQPNGVLGNRATTEALCRAAAPTVYCPTGVQALISYTGDDLASMPANHGVPANLPIESLNGTRIANNWADLFDGNGITTSLLDAGVTGPSVIYTGTNTNGTVASNCTDWTTTSGQFTTGTPSSNNQFWITSTAGTITCNASDRMVCICY